MTERRQFVGHVAGEAEQFTGLDREITVDKGAMTLRVHDGDKAGGYPLMRADMANLDSTILNTRLAGFERTSNKISTLTSSATNQQYVGAREIYNKLLSTHAVGDIKTSLQQSNHGTWLLCNGQAVSRTDYPKLFSLIGVGFGSGDGVSTFNLPDYRGKFLRGLGGNSASDFYTAQEEGIPDHYHKIGVHWYTPEGGGRRIWTFGHANEDWSDYGPDYQNSDEASTSWASKSNSAYKREASGHVTPENFAVNYFIYAL